MIGPVRRGEAGEWFHTRWMPALVLLEDDERELPETRPDDDAFDHRYGCRCDVCRRPTGLYYKRAKRTTSAGARPSAPRARRP